jgi:co-chaperonin GroES (HSP10)
VKIRPLKGKVLVTDLERGARVVNGIIIPNDDGQSRGIRPRWGKVYGVGPDIKEIKVGQWILMEHARWTRMIKITDDDGTELQLWGVDWPAAVMLVSDEDPETAIWSKWT